MYSMLPLQIQTVTSKEEIPPPAHHHQQYHNHLHHHHNSHRFGRNSTKWAAKYVVKKSLQFKSGMNVLGAC